MIRWLRDKLRLKPYSLSSLLLPFPLTTLPFPPPSFYHLSCPLFSTLLPSLLSSPFPSHITLSFSPPYLSARAGQHLGGRPEGRHGVAPCRRFFARFARGNSKAAGGYEASLAELLEDAVQVMRERQDRLFGVTRLHTPRRRSR